MEGFRVVLSMFIFCMSTYLLADLLINGFSFVVLAGCIAGFAAVRFLWPRNYREDSLWYEFLELVFDLPYKATALTLRFIGNLFRSKDGGIGLD